MLGELGYILIFLAFVSSLVMATFSWIELKSSDLDDSISLPLSKIAVWFHTLTVIGAVVILFVIIYGGHYEFHYAWKHSSSDLPYYYVLASFWEGQEGSFLIWVFWNALIILFFLRRIRAAGSYVLVVYSLIQCFLLSMILGVVVGDLKIGSSPFIMLKDTIVDPVFQSKPDFIPQDGTGLNPLLQNIWMVIHPPVIFLGYALSALPFSFCLGGILNKRYSDWMREAQLWLVVCIGVLGAGIMMGAYWAYETLNFGGYWNWDPVENAILIPWVVMLAALHGLILWKKKGLGLSFSAALVLVSFVLIIYSTFLTRSGILGDSSVHAFTDLGLSGQLVFFLVVILFISVWAWFRISAFENSSNQPTRLNDSSFWLMVGVAMFCLSAFQVFIPTSIPVWNTILELFGVDGDVAPPTNPVQFYSNFQLGFAIVFGISMGLAQYFHWRSSDVKIRFEQDFFWPLCVTLVLSSIIILMGRVHHWSYILLVISSVFGLSTCVKLIARKITIVPLGGAFAHLGFSVMLIGFVLSAGHSKLISRNLSINMNQSSLPAHNVQEHALLNRNVTTELNGYKFKYIGTQLTLKEDDSRVDGDHLMDTNIPEYKVLKQPSMTSEGRLLDEGDTVEIDPININYAVMVSHGNDQFVLEPRMQNNDQMGYLASPAVYSFWDKDVYLHVSNFPNPDKMEWSAFERMELVPGQQSSYQGLEVELSDSYRVEKIAGHTMKDHSLAIETNVIIRDDQNSYLTKPIYLIEEGQVRLLPDVNDALGVRVLIEKIDPTSGKMTLMLSHAQRDWITVKVREMPFIGLVWLGTLILLMGVGIAAYQRIRYPGLQEKGMRVVYRKPLSDVLVAKQLMVK